MRWLLISVMATAVTVAAKTVTYDFNATWVKANPDGLQEREVIGINGVWPLPIIEVDKGDRLVVNFYNGLGDTSSSIHFHGMFQNTTNHMDGPSMVTQCPVPPGSSFTYNFTVDQNGTYWYHCHTDYCYPDGYRQALLVHDKDAYFTDEYEDEFVFTMSDWYHDLSKAVLSKEFMSVYNPTGAEPIPDSFLVNDAVSANFSVTAGKKYLIHLINISAFVAQYFYIENMNFTIVEVDGVYVEPAVADTLYLAVAQRYSILVTAPNSTDVNPVMVMVADADLLDTIPSSLQLNVSSWLVVNEDVDLLQADITVAVCDDLVPYDDFYLVPADGVGLYENPDVTINVTVYMIDLMTGANYAFLNNITYTAPVVPSLYTALSAGVYNSTATVYGEYTHPVVLEHNQVVELIVNNDDTGTHPFHLHGHNFQIIDRAPGYGADFYDYNDLAAGVQYDPDDHSSFPSVPVRRDVAVLPAQGYMVLRFVADNPGVWIFHCHIDWHLASGLAMIFIEAPELIASRMEPIPDDHYAACAAGSVSYTGNAAGNTEDYLDLKGQPEQPGWIPQGFTKRGEVAMAFSVLSAIIGIASLTVYGLSDLKHKPPTEIAGSQIVDTEDKAVSNDVMPESE
ncbi:Cupredoxin [Limtongia smithiae]|uniref:Cupredoxin n=1 Tax=Limtongia smithiae TaxID=1125753 RepID=UPI0034CE5819